MTGRVLAVDTTSDFGSLALAEHSRVLEEIVLHSNEGFAHLLFPHMESLLNRHGWALESVDCFAAAAGPGSFTGVRVGLAAMKGLAETLGRAASAVSNLRALASFGQAERRAVFFDARRGEIYGAVYSAGGEVLQAEVVQPFPQWLAGLPDGDLEFVTPQVGVFAAAIATSRFSRAMVTEAPRAIAGAVALLAEPVDPVGVDANYVRRSDAEMFWVDR